MKNYKIFGILLIISMGVSQPLHAQIKKVAQTGIQLLKIDPSARAAAMGGAYSMVGDDASALFSNPVGISRVQSNVDVFISRVDWIADISYIAGGVVKNMGNLGSIGVSFMASDYGDIFGTRVSSNEQGYEETGSVDVGAYTIGISYAKSLTDKFSVGGQVKYVAQHLGENLLIDGSTVENKVSGMGFDFGTVYYAGFKSLRFGMNIRNFSPQFKYEDTAFQLPLTFSIGAAIDVMDFVGESNNSLLISLDALHPRDYTERIHFGAEYLFMGIFSLRGGYKFNYDEEGLTAGAGVNVDISGTDMNFDYSFSDFGVFDAVNRFSIGFSF